MAEVFDDLYSVNVNGHTEQKKTGGQTLTYLSWPFAWAEVKKRYPDAHYEIEKFDGLPYVFDPKTGYMVYTNVTIENITHEMWLPVMDGANKAMKAEQYNYKVADWKWDDNLRKRVKSGDIDKSVEAATMFDINKTIMRCLVKNLAMFGLGLYIFAGEDIPVSDTPAEINVDAHERAELLKQANEMIIQCADLFKVKNAEVVEKLKTAGVKMESITSADAENLEISISLMNKWILKAGEKK